MAPAGATVPPVLIVGAGPAGLFHAFELGLLGIASQIVDALPEAGGQVVALYADKPIYDIPAQPVCTGRELTAQLLAQLRPFSPPLMLGQQVAAIRPHDAGAGGGFTVTLAPAQPGRGTGATLHASALVLATGVGAFLPRQPKLPGLDSLDGTRRFYDVDDPGRHQGRHVVVLGGEAEAIAGAVALSAAGAKVTVVHRRAVALPAGMRMLAAMPLAVDLSASGRIVLHLERFDDAAGDAADADLAFDGPRGTVSADALFVLQGLSPKLGPLADWGLALTRREVSVDTATFATSVPGVFAIGDAIAYPGKKRLILSAFHEAALAAYGVAAHLHPERAFPLEYTTSSSRIHRALGVD